MTPVTTTPESFGTMGHTETESVGDDEAGR